MNNLYIPLEGEFKEITSLQNFVIVGANGGKIEALGTICMFTAQKQILSGWLASQTDVLAEDWVIISE